jgi:hypothetical protein
MAHERTEIYGKSSPRRSSTSERALHRVRRAASAHRTSESRDRALPEWGPPGDTGAGGVPSALRVYSSLSLQASEREVRCIHHVKY